MLRHGPRSLNAPPEPVPDHRATAATACAVLLTGCSIGSLFLLLHTAIDSVPPYTAAAAALVVAAAFHAVALALAALADAPLRAHLAACATPVFALQALVGGAMRFGGPLVLVSVALNRSVTVGAVGALAAFAPTVTVLALAAYSPEDRTFTHKASIASAVVAVAGMALVLSHPLDDSVAASFATYLSVLGAAVSQGLAGAFSRRFMSTTRPWLRAAGQLLGGAVVAVVLALALEPSSGFPELSSASSDSLLSLLATGVACLGLPVLAYDALTDTDVLLDAHQQRIVPDIMDYALGLVPLVAIVEGAVFNDELTDASDQFLFTLVAGGVLLTASSMAINHLFFAANHVVYYEPLLPKAAGTGYGSVPPRDDVPQHKRGHNPEETASFLSRVTFWFTNPLMGIGYREQMDRLNEHWPISLEDEADTVHGGFEPIWNRQREGSGNFFMALVSLFRFRLARMFFFDLCSKTCEFAGPIFVQFILEYLDKDPDNRTLSEGLIYCVCLFAIPITGQLCKAQFFHTAVRCLVQSRSVVASSVYRKSLRVSAVARQTTATGEIVNLMGNDADKIGQMWMGISYMFLEPIRISVILYLLHNTIGSAAWAGLGAMLIFLPFMVVVMYIVSRLETKRLAVADRRVKLTNEIISGIRVCKMYAWETAFGERVRGLRDEETRILRRMNFSRSFIIFTFGAMPAFVAVATFSVYTKVQGNDLEPSKVFTALALFNLLRMPLLMLPNSITWTVQGRVSIARVRRYLLLDEVADDVVINKGAQAPTAIQVSNATFSWEADPGPGAFRLANISLSVPRGKLTAVVGTVGSGKSSLVSAILGEMHRDVSTGPVYLNGSVAYVSQQAWIQNATVRDNILFGLPYDHARYRRAVAVSALEQDLSILPAGDRTEIGEKGINLSGGQKQRVSLARAVYHDADIYILDDPLSAVDAHVGRFIFDECISGQLQDKSRLFVTNQLQFLPQCDHIVVLSDGSVSETGTYDELIAARGAFAALIEAHVLDDGADDADADPNADPDADPGQQPSPAPSPAISAVAADATSVEPMRKRTVSRDEVRDAGSTLVQQEEKERGSVALSVYLHYFKAAGGWGMLTLVVASMFGAQGCQIAADLWLAAWTDDAFDKSDSFYLNYYFAILGLGVPMLLSRGLLFALGGYYASRNLHDRLLTNILRAPTTFFDVTPVGRILNRFSKDTEAIDALLPPLLEDSSAVALLVLAYLVTITILNPPFVFVLLIILALYSRAHIYYHRTAIQIQRIESVTRSPIFNNFSETLSGVTIIKAFGKAAESIRENSVRVDRNVRDYFLLRLINRWINIRLETFNVVITTTTAVIVVITRDSVDPSLAGVSLTYALTIGTVLGYFVLLSTEAETKMNSVERLRFYSEIDQEAAPHQPGAVPPGWPKKGAVAFKGCSLRYRPGLELVLKGVSLDVAPGEKIGVAGRTGSGKSSLMVALFRMVELTAGTIRVDGTDTKRIGLRDLRSGITIIPQDPWMISGDVRSNLDPFHEHSDDAIWRVLEMVRLATTVRSQGGLDMRVAEYGENFSVGQRQLVCLARALLRSPRILVMDEATASVDAGTDDLIQQTVRREFKHSTVLTIAHRLNSILDSDRILLMDAGQVAEYAPPGELLANPRSKFAMMVQDMSNKS